ncbi:MULTISPECIES: Rv2175c family DNA-binding protein [unclassified Nocardia]|uniref:Rv2175c family DNA-binding protein n=1 Tax=Nocardia sp. NPDC060220 TaxID=3347076 RepID=UPI0036468CA3
MSAFPCSDDVLPDTETIVSLPEAADILGVPVTSVHQLLRDHQILAIRRHGVVGIPSRFFDSEDEIVRMLPGVITVMRDAKYTDEDILGWLYTDDPSLPGRPVDALHGQLAREVVRRAHAEPF